MSHRQSAALVIKDTRSKAAAIATQCRVINRHDVITEDRTAPTACHIHRQVRVDDCQCTVNIANRTAVTLEEYLAASHRNVLQSQALIGINVEDPVQTHRIDRRFVRPVTNDDQRVIANSNHIKVTERTGVFSRHQRNRTELRNIITNDKGDRCADQRLIGHVCQIFNGLRRRSHWGERK